MLFTTSFVSILSVLAIGLLSNEIKVVAQDTTGIPVCAYGCFLDGITKSGCALSDVACQCTTGKQTISATVTSCVQKSCSADDAADVQPASNKICEKHLSSSGTSSSETAASVATNSAEGSIATSGSGTTSGSGNENSATTAIIDAAGYYGFAAFVAVGMALGL